MTTKTKIIYINKNVEKAKYCSTIVTSLFLNIKQKDEKSKVFSSRTKAAQGERKQMMHGVSTRY